MDSAISELCGLLVRSFLSVARSETSVVCVLPPKFKHTQIHKRALFDNTNLKDMLTKSLCHEGNGRPLPDCM